MPSGRYPTVMQLLDTFRQYRLQTAAVVTAAVLVVIFLIGIILTAPVDSGSVEREVVIESGMGATDVGHLLAEQRVIRHAWVFRLYVRVTDRQKDLQAGRYLLCPCDSTFDVVSAIVSGDALSNDRVVTVPEGMNAWELQALFADAELSGAAGVLPQLLETEGRLFPDTYRIDEGAGVAELLERMSQTFEQRAGQYTDEQVIVASMLEKEAKTAEDMALVAGIMYRRLEIGMPLQIDATVGYGWCLRTQGALGACDVTQAPIRFELEVDGSYNTYARAGLPEGPISNPGLRALEAAANPKESEYLFYLSTRDGSDIIYSRTNKEHLQNRRKHLGF